MAIKLTKNALREEELKLKQLDRYLPTLQLKKSLLQMEVNSTKLELEELSREFETQKKAAEEFSPLLSLSGDVNILQYVEVKHVVKTYENIAGVEIPLFEGVSFPEEDYFLFNTPPWMEGVISKLKQTIILKERINVMMEKKRALNKELRDVTIRVNLFEKILIPRCLTNIKKIRVFLGDQALAAVAQAKVAKNKILKIA